jgi:hypothetical protein
LVMLPECPFLVPMCEMNAGKTLKLGKIEAWFIKERVYIE